MTAITTFILGIASYIIVRSVWTTRTDPMQDLADKLAEVSVLSLGPDDVVVVSTPKLSEPNMAKLRLNLAQYFAGRKVCVLEGIKIVAAREIPT